VGRISCTKRGGRAQREYGKEEKDNKEKKNIWICQTKKNRIRIEIRRKKIVAINVASLSLGIDYI